MWRRASGRVPRYCARRCRGWYLPLLKMAFSQRLTRPPQWRDFRRLGLLSIDNLDDTANAIVLCPNCHRVYDRTPASPGFVFFPQDIQWFLRCEVTDYERRRRLREANKHRTVRIPPTAQQYMEYQRDDERSSDEEKPAGLYARCILRDYFPWKMPGQGPVHPGQVSPAVWHGDPMTSLKRTFAVLANPMVRGIPQEARRQLLELSALYSAHDEEDEHLAEDYMAGDNSQQSWSDQDQGHRTGERQARQENQGEQCHTEEGELRTQQSHHIASSGGTQQRRHVNVIAARKNGSPRGRRSTSSWGDSGIALEPHTSTATGWRKRKGSAQRSHAQRSDDAWEWGPMATAMDAAEHFSRMKRIRH